MTTLVSVKNVVKRYIRGKQKVVIQNTGFDAVVPVGEGILEFSTLEGAAAA